LSQQPDRETTVSEESKSGSKRRRRGRGEGSIYQRADGRWAAALTIGFRGGKRVRRQIYGTTRTEVQGKLNRVLTNLQDGLEPPPAKQTVKQFLEHWIETVAKPRLRPRTYEGYKQHLEAHVIPALGHLRLHALSPQQVQAMLAGLQLKKLAPRTIRGVRAVLRAALSDAMRWGLVARNSAALAYAPKVTKPELEVLSPEQAKALLTIADGERLEGFLNVVLASGLRLGEALGLAWKDVDLEKGTLRVRQALQRVNGEVKFVEPKSERSRRVVNLPAFAIEALKQHIQLQRKEKVLAGTRWVDSGLVFTSMIGTPMDERNVRREFRNLLKAAELPEIRIHDLRHTTATLLLTQGVHPRVVMETLGHSQISLTLDTYTHVLPSLQAEAAKRMDEAIGCQIGCQTETETSSGPEKSPNSSEDLVSRGGIEPPTRRLRVCCSAN
jgi:integrase